MPVRPAPEGPPEPWSDDDFRPVEAVLRARPHAVMLTPQRLGLIRARLQSRLRTGGVPSFTWFHEPEWIAGNRRSVCWAKTSQ